MIYDLKDVSKTFGERGAVTAAIRKITLNISPGEQVALLGASGSGKTTLLRLLNGSIFPSSGHMFYRESDVAAMNQVQLREMRRRTGSIYQQHYLVSSMSVLANTLSGALGRWGLANTLVNFVHPRRAEVERAEECLEAVGLKEKRRYRCDQLSGGQQQRLAIARTLMQKPDVILADEPVASLDPALSDEVLELLVRLADAAQLTLVISLHQVELAQRHAKRIVALRDGEIAFDLAAGELDRGTVSHLYRSSREGGAHASVQAATQITGGHGVIQSSQRRSCIR